MKAIAIDFTDGTQTLIPYMVQHSISQFLGFYYPGKILDKAEAIEIPNPKGGL